MKPLTSVWPWRGDPGPHSRKNSPLLGSAKLTGHDGRRKGPCPPAPPVSAAPKCHWPRRGPSRSMPGSQPPATCPRAFSGWRAGLVRSPGKQGILPYTLCPTRRLTCLCSHGPGSTSGHHASPLLSFSRKELGAPTSSLTKDRMRFLFRKEPGVSSTGRRGVWG